METLSERKLATARSRMVLLLKSPTATEVGPSPAPKLTAGVTNVPLPFPKSMETLSETTLAVARSRMVSLLKSPTATDVGPNPTPKLSAGVTNVPLPFPKSMETLSESKLATARSRTVSLLKSPTATENGASPAPKLTAGVTNVPLPFPKSIDTLLESKLATARSRIVSLLKSPTATENGPSPAPKLTAGVTNNVLLPVPKSMETLSELRLATARSRKLGSTNNTLSIIHVWGFPIVISPSHSSEKLVQINKSSSKVEPASNPIVLHIAGMTESSPCSVTLYGPASNATLVPVPDEPGKLF